MIIDCANIPDEMSGFILEKGCYYFVISEISIEWTRTNLEMIKILFESYEGHKVYDNIVLNDESEQLKRRFKSFINNIMLVYTKGKSEVYNKPFDSENINRLKGCVVYALVNKTEYQGKERNIIEFDGYYKGWNLLKTQFRKNQSAVIQKVLELFPGAVIVQDKTNEPQNNNNLNNKQVKQNTNPKQQKKEEPQNNYIPENYIPPDVEESQINEDIPF